MFESRESRVKRRNEAHEAAPCPVPPAPRRAISLTEVLISLGILTLGLLGAAALFPVGSHYVQKATIADNGHAIAQAVMSDIIARGTINPKAWLVMVPRANGSYPSHAPFPSDGIYVSAKRNATFTRPFARTLGEALAQPAAAIDPTLIGRQFGNAYVIDPLYIASVTVRNEAEFQNEVAYAFPASAMWIAPKSGGTYYTAPAWKPWEGGNNAEKVWPIRRVTLQDSSGWPMGIDMASHIFRGSDDLTTDLPSRTDRPARQNWQAADLDSDGFIDDPLARSRIGDYSWIVSVVPTTNAARDALTSNPEGFSYDVSVVVFHKRVLPRDTARISGVAQAAADEATIGASVISTGLNGGELLLRNMGGNATDPYQNLRTGNWVMLCGPHPNSTPTDPRFFMNWYEVLSIQDGDNKSQRLVSVRGPQWPWLPYGTNPHNYDALSNSLCVGIFRGAVAVHTKTVRLEGPRGGDVGTTLVPGPGVTSPPLGPY